MLLLAQQRCFQRLSEKIGRALFISGFTVHEQVSAISDGEFIGLWLCHNHLAVKPSRIWKLRSALRKVVQFHRISGKRLEVLVGHVAWTVLIR